MSIEQSLFSWDGWDGDSECMIFYNPILKVQIGEYPIGTKFGCASILQQRDGAVLQFDNHGEENSEGFAPNIPVAAFKLYYRVGESVPIKNYQQGF